MSHRRYTYNIVTRPGCSHICYYVLIKWCCVSTIFPHQDTAHNVVSILLKLQSTSAKAHSLCKQCLHDLHFLKKGPFSTNISKLARADISCHFMKTRSLCRTVYSMNGFQGQQRIRDIMLPQSDPYYLKPICLPQSARIPMI